MELDPAVIRILASIEREHDDAAKAEEWQGSSDSNRGPSVLETDALTS